MVPDSVPDDDNQSLLCDLRKIVPECENLEERYVKEWITDDQVLENKTLAVEEIISVLCQQTDIDEDKIKERKKRRGQRGKTQSQRCIGSITAGSMIRRTTR